MSPSKEAFEHKQGLLGEMRMAMHTKIGGSIIQEHEMKLVQALEQNLMLTKMYDDKVKDKEKMFMKYAEAQGQYLEIMRNLTRFRSNFLTRHSLRSKFLETQIISDDLGKLIQTNREIL